VYLELNQSQTRVLNGACIHVSKHLMRSSHFKGHVSAAIEGRVSTSIEGCVSKTIEGRVPTPTKSRVSSALRVASSQQSRVAPQLPLKFVSLLDQCDNHVCRAAFFHTQGVRPCFCNQFNGTLERAIDNSTSLTIHQ